MEAWVPYPSCTLKNLGCLGSRRHWQLGGDIVPHFPCLPTVSNRWCQEAVPSPQPVPDLEVGVSRVVVKAARDKGCLSDTRSDCGRCFPDAGPQLIPTQAGGSAPPPATPTGPPQGVGSGGGGAAPSQLSLLSPEGMSADFLKSDPGRPPALPPLTWTCSLWNRRRGEGAHLGGRGQVLLPLRPPAA